MNELIELLKASDATIYVIGALDHQSSTARDRARSTLQVIAETTGGQAFFPSSVKELDQMYEKVLAEIRAQYTIGYLSTNERSDGAWRKIEIKMASKENRDARTRTIILLNASASLGVRFRLTPRRMRVRFLCELQYHADFLGQTLVSDAIESKTKDGTLIKLGRRVDFGGLDVFHGPHIQFVGIF